MRMNYELIGLFGTVLILIGFMSDSEKKIRLFDMAGSFCFVAYGILLHAWSNVVLNGALIIIHIVKIKKMRGYGREKSGQTAERI